MLYLIAIVFPPAAVLLSGKLLEALLNAMLTFVVGLFLASMSGTSALVPLIILVAWVPGTLHAVLVVGSRHADQRASRIIEAIHAQAEWASMRSKSPSVSAADLIHPKAQRP